MLYSIMHAREHRHQGIRPNRWKRNLWHQDQTTNKEESRSPSGWRGCDDSTAKNNRDTYGSHLEKQIIVFP